jgi:hypothetical protein
VQAQTRDAPRHPVEDLRRDTPGERVAAPCLPAADQVEPLVQLREQARNLGRVVLEVGVDGDDDVAVGVCEAGRERRRLAEVLAQADDANVVVCAVEPGQRCIGAVG